MEKISVIFVGTGTLGVPTLEALLKDERIHVPFIVTGKDTPQGRGQKLGISPIKQIGILNKLVIQQPEKIKDLKQEFIQAKPDFILVADYGEIVPQEVLEWAKIAPVNIHPSLLPKYRGPTPMHATLLNADTLTGVSWIIMSPKMDAGDIIHQEKFPVDPADNYLTLSTKLSNFAAEKTADVLLEYKKTGHKIPQKESDATYCKMISKSDGIIDINKEPAAQILAKIKAYYIWPGSTIIWNNKRIKLLDAEIAEQKIDTGKIEVVNRKLLIGTSNGTLAPTIVQPESKKPMKVEDFVRGLK